MFTANELLEVAEVVAILTARYREQADRYEKQQAEHRAAFGARTEADRKIIAGLREEVKRLQWENMTMHQDAEDGYTEAIKVLGDPIALSKERDALRAEVAALKSQTPNQHGRWVRATSEKCTHAKAGEVVSVRGYLVRTNSGEFLWEGKDCEPCDPPQTEPVPKCAHPVAVGGYLRRLTGFNTTPAGEVARVTLVDDDDDASQLEYEVARPNGEKGRWSAKGCEPCDPPEATHDTAQGKAAAESAVRGPLQAQPKMDTAALDAGRMLH